MPDAYAWDTHGFAKSPFRLPTRRATEVVFQANAEAVRSGAEEVMPDHLLLALTYQEESMAARILTGLGVSLTAIRNALDLRSAVEPSSPPESGLLMSTGAKLAVDCAYEEARSLDNLFIGVEHLLLGLMRCPDCQAEQVLGRFGVSAEQFHQEIHRMKWG